LEKKRVKILSIAAGTLLVANLLLGFVLALQVFRVRPTEYGRGIAISDLYYTGGFASDNSNYSINIYGRIYNLDKEAKIYEVIYYYINCDDKSIQISGGLDSIDPKENKQLVNILRIDNSNDDLLEITKVGIVRVDIYFDIPIQN